MLVEFSWWSKTYQCSIAADRPPRIEIPFRPCVLKPAFMLVLEWKATDDIRGIELYRPVAEVR